MLMTSGWLEREWERKAKKKSGQHHFTLSLTFFSSLSESLSVQKCYIFGQGIQRCCWNDFWVKRERGRKNKRKKEKEERKKSFSRKQNLFFRTKDSDEKRRRWNEGEERNGGRRNGKDVNWDWREKKRRQGEEMMKRKKKVSGKIKWKGKKKRRRKEEEEEEKKEGRNFLPLLFKLMLDGWMDLGYRDEENLSPSLSLFLILSLFLRERRRRRRKRKKETKFCSIVLFWWIFHSIITSLSFPFLDMERKEHKLWNCKREREKKEVKRKREREEKRKGFRSFSTKSILPSLPSRTTLLQTSLSLSLCLSVTLSISLSFSFSSLHSNVIQLYLAIFNGGKCFFYGRKKQVLKECEWNENEVVPWQTSKWERRGWKGGGGRKKKKRKERRKKEEWEETWIGNYILHRYQSLNCPFHRYITSFFLLSLFLPFFSLPLLFQEDGKWEIRERERERTFLGGRSFDSRPWFRISITFKEWSVSSSSPTIFSLSFSSFLSLSLWYILSLATKRERERKRARERLSRQNVTPRKENEDGKRRRVRNGIANGNSREGKERKNWNGQRGRERERKKGRRERIEEAKSWIPDQDLRSGNNLLLFLHPFSPLFSFFLSLSFHEIYFSKTTNLDEH